MIDPNALSERAADLVEKAVAAGATSADAIAVESTSLSASLLDGRVEATDHSEGVDIGLRVFVGKRSAIVSTTSMDRTGFGDLAERALAMARLAPESPFEGIDPAPRPARERQLDLVDSGAAPEMEALKERAAAAEEAGRAIAGVSRSGGAGASWGRTAVALVTSAGFSGAYEATRHGVAMTAISGEGGHMEREYDWSSARHLSDLRSPEDVGRVAGKRAADRIGARQGPSGRVPVIFEPRMARSLIGHLLGAINGAAIARKSSFLTGRMDEPIASAALSVTDDPFIPRGSASRPFDGDGRSDGRLTLLEEGVLRAWLLDLAAARELSLAPNGRAVRGTGGHPSPSATNVLVSGGAETPEALMQRAGRGLLVTQLMGRGANLVNGDYSRGASGFWFENGRIQYPVNEITIAGNLGEMLASIIPANDVDESDRIACPSLMTGDMTIAGT
ncbi:MAG: TldD/PmbA family protein [Flavobacteriaceae bacterium]